MPNTYLHLYIHIHIYFDILIHVHSQLQTFTVTVNITFMCIHCFINNDCDVPRVLSVSYHGYEFYAHVSNVLCNRNVSSLCWAACTCTCKHDTVSLDAQPLNAPPLAIAMYSSYEEGTLFRRCVQRPSRHFFLSPSFFLFLRRHKDRTTTRRHDADAHPPPFCVEAPKYCSHLKVTWEMLSSSS